MTESNPNVEIEFFSAPKRQKTDAVEDKKVDDEAQSLQKAITPSLEVDVPQKGIAEPTKAEIQMTQRATADPDDPAVLLQGMLGQLPGIDGSRAAGMALNADVALHNLGVKAKRQEKLARREERRQKQGKTKRRRIR